MKKTVMIIGGDRRMIYAMDYFVEAGYHVKALGFDDVTLREEIKKIKMDQLTHENMIVSGIPMSKDGETLYAPLQQKAIYLKDLEVQGDTYYLSMAPKSYKEVDSAYDPLENQCFIEQNAIPTAEGTIKEWLLLTDRQLYGQKALVLGFGTVAKALALRLKGLGVEVTIMARREEVREEAKITGYGSVSLEDFKTILDRFDAIFNTVPHPLFCEKDLKKINPSAVLLDISSPPYSFDLDVALACSLKAKILPGIPAKYVPKTAGEILAMTILSLEEGND